MQTQALDERTLVLGGVWLLTNILGERSVAGRYYSVLSQAAATPSWGPDTQAWSSKCTLHKKKLGAEAKEKQLSSTEYS